MSDDEHSASATEVYSDDECMTNEPMDIDFLEHTLADLRDAYKRSRNQQRLTVTIVREPEQDVDPDLEPVAKRRRLNPTN